MLTDPQIARLLDIANAGCHKGMVLKARTIYDGVLAVRPGHIPALIGQALSHIAIGEYEQAETILRGNVLSKHPDDSEAIAMLGLCYCLAGKNHEAQELLHPLADGTDTSASLARSLLESMEKS